MEIIAVTSTHDPANEHAIINSLFKAGLRILHIRKPNYTTEEMAKYILKIDEAYHDRLVIHSHHELALRFKIRGIHLTEAHRKNKFMLRLKLMWYKFIKSSMHISASYHSFSSIRKTRRHYNYVFFSSVFESISKKEHKPAHSLAKIREGIERTEHRIIGLGGIDEDKIPLVKTVGFYGIALQGCLWDSPDPLLKYRKIAELCAL